MNNYFSKLLFIPFLLLAGCAGTDVKPAYDNLAFEITDTTRLYSFTNKKYGFYFGRTNADFNDGWMGWTLREQRVFNDYNIFIGGTKLKRENSTAYVYPHLIKRIYKDGVEEELCFADSADLILLSLRNIGNKKLSFKLAGLNGSDFSQSGNLLKAKLDGILPGFSMYITSDVNLTNNSGTIEFSESDSVKIILCASDTVIDYHSILNNFNRITAQKKNRIEKLLAGSFVTTNNEDFNNALAWAKVSLDALITEQDFTGIWAGLPWFNNNWGRDTFIAFPGATLVTGNYADAKEILMGFAKFQDVNPSSRYYGRIPNRVTLKESIYNTADGTPWFIIQSYNYYKYSGDINFIKEIYPAIKLAFNAALKNNIDENGFLKHADAETWMDAVGPNGPWSPRGDRAVDIQVLWYKQLLYSAEIGELMDDKNFVEQTSTIAQKVKYNFERFYLSNSKDFLFDRLKTDGSRDSSTRPNAFFALNEPGLFSSSLTRLKILGSLLNKTVFSYGVLSLSQEESNFHPYHNYPPYYVKDAAYHNGIIWQWTSGPVITSLCGFGKQDTAWVLTKELTHQLLHRGAAGTLAELMDAFPREGSQKPELSGTFSQAWSLAEYIRNFYQDYLGVSVDAPAKTLYLVPTLPEELDRIEFNQKVGSDVVKIKYMFGNDYYRIELDARNIKDSIDLGAAIINRADANFQLKTSVRKNDKLSIEVPAYSNALKEMKVIRNGNAIRVSSQIYNEPPQNSELYDKVSFAKPSLNKNLKALKGPGYTLLSNADVKRNNNNSKTLFNVSDQSNDEAYIYPTNPNFADGILDLTNFILKEDSDNYYFELSYRNLSNPGWHNEYGYQLTFTSILIQTNAAAAAIKNVNSNSKYILDNKRMANYIINIGGGVEIKNAEDNILCAYIPKPADITNTLGNISDKKISFSIPKKYLNGISSKSLITILCGAQDDHGGAGIGEFRAVEGKAGEWTGGGRKNEGQSNVYDVILIN